MMSWFLLMVQLFSVLRIAAGFNFSKPNCVNQCGDVKIPYPFGIGANCYYNQSYEITCNMSSSVSSKPFFQHLNLEVLDIVWPGRYPLRDAEGNSVNDSRYGGTQVLTVALPRTNLCGGSSTKKIYSPDLKGSPYRFSSEYNILTVEGCGNSAAIKQRNGKILAECGVSVCGGYAFNSTLYSCDGLSCCQTSLDLTSDTVWISYLDFYEIDVILGQSTNPMSCNASIALFSKIPDEFKTLNGSLSSLATIPIVLEWKATSFPPLLCHDSLACVCPFPYEGYPYLPNGCQVMQACQKCKSSCELSYNNKNTGPFSYYGCKKHLWFRQASFRAFFIGGGELAGELCCWP